MAFPTVAATNTSANSTVTTSHTVNLPASIASGDLLIVFFGTQEKPTITTPSGWTLLRNIVERPGVSETCQASIFYRVADGGEGATLSVTTGTSWRSAHISMRITGYSGTPEASTGTSGGSGDPNPDSLTPSGGAKDYLWLALGGNRGGGISAAPTNYSNLLTSSASSNIGIGVGRRELNASSEDPGAFTDTGSEWFAGTFSVTGTGSSAKALATLGVG